MLFDIADDRLKYDEHFDEFPGRREHAFVYTACICGDEGGEVIATTTRHRNFQPVMACTRCGSLRANPYFTPETAAYYYAEVYGPVKRKSEPPDHLQARQRETGLGPFLAPWMAEIESVLDFGGGAGGRVLDLHDAGLRVALHEVEGQYSAAGYAAGLRRHEAGQRYDLVVFSHVVEHLLDPAAELSTIIDEYCRPGGLLLLATPIIDRSPAHKWLRLFHMAHKYYFCQDALIGLAGKCGGQLLTDNGHDTYLFRLGAAQTDAWVETAYRRGRDGTAAALRKAYRRRLPGDLLRRIGR